MLRFSLLLLALVAATNGQRCLKNIASYTVASGPCKDTVVSFSGGYCIGDPVQVGSGGDVPTWTADNLAERLVGESMESMTAVDTAGCASQCTLLGYTVKSGACEAANMCQKMAEVYTSSRLACTEDADCQAVVQTNGDGWRKGAAPPCCSWIYDQSLPCEGVPGEFKTAYIKTIKILESCATEDCFSSASSFSLSLLAPLLAASAALFATRV